MRLAVARTAPPMLGLAVCLGVLLSACGGSLDPGPLPTATSQSPVAVSPSSAPTTTPSTTPTATPSICSSPATSATYQLPGARVLAGNLQVKDETLGTGKTAKVGDKISVNYTGSLTDGTVFDKSTADNGGKPISFTLSSSNVIPGWVEGIAGMRVGGTRELVIPAALGYGCPANHTIPADSTLIFTVQLVGVS